MRNYICIVSDPIKFGRGHLARQIQIQREFEKLGIHYPININKDEQTSFQLKKNTSLILDLSNLDQEPELDFLNQFSEIIGFDASGEVIPDRNFVVVAHPGREYRATKYVSIGLQNLVIRSDISVIKNTQNIVGRDFLLISLGFSAGTKAYRHALALTRALPNTHKILASGGELEIHPSDDLEIIVDSPNFIDLLTTAKAVITNGGTTYVESLLLGKSVLSIPQTRDEQNFLDVLYPLTNYDGKLPGFRQINSEKAAKAGVGTDSAKRLCQIMIENS